MQGTTIINHQQHVGLQKLSVLAGITHSSVGPNKKYKFIQDETSGESALVCSCFRILENLELTCAVGQLVYQTVQAHQKVYRTGSGCLLYLAGAWSRAALDCLQRGISVAHIISAMSEGMEVCLNVCWKCRILTEDLGVEQSESCTVASQGLGLPLSKKPFVEASQTKCHFNSVFNSSTMDKAVLLVLLCLQVFLLITAFTSTDAAALVVDDQPQSPPLVEGANVSNREEGKQRAIPRSNCWPFIGACSIFGKVPPRSTKSGDINGRQRKTVQI